MHFVSRSWSANARSRKQSGTDSIAKSLARPPRTDEPASPARQRKSDVGRLPLLFYALVAVLLLAAMSLLFGCGGGSAAEDNSASSGSAAGTVALLITDMPIEARSRSLQIQRSATRRACSTC